MILALLKAGMHGVIIGAYDKIITRAEEVSHIISYLPTFVGVNLTVLASVSLPRR